MAGQIEVSLGSVVLLEGGAHLGLVQALWEAGSGKPLLQVRTVLRGQETVLGDAAASDELFVTSQTLTR